MRIFATPVPAFFEREKPISSRAKPACMNSTSTAARNTSIVFSGTVSPNTPLPDASRVSADAVTGTSSVAISASAASPKARFIALTS